MKKKSLYALYIGINQYKHPKIKVLHGPVPDAERMQQVIRQRFGAEFEIKSKLLRNHEATRQGIIQAILRHLGAAQEGDRLLLFFAGHGAKCSSAKEFRRYYPEQQDEGWVCYDTAYNGAYLLADKEIAALLAFIQKPNQHCLVMVDACHSDSSLRGGSEAQGYQVRAAPCPFREKYRRQLDYYLDDAFLQKYEREGRPEGQLYQYYSKQYEKLGRIELPQKTGLLLAACESDREALEHWGRGLFSGWLEQELLNPEPYSYEQLHIRVAARAKAERDKWIKGEFHIRQEPTLNAHSIHPKQVFLQEQMLQDQDRWLVYWDAKEKVWKTAFTAPMGIEWLGASNIPVDIFAELEATSAIGQAAISHVNLRSSYLQIAYEAPRLLKGLDKNKWYYLQLRQAHPKPLKLYVEGSEADKATVRSYLQRFYPEAVQLTTATDARFHLCWQEAKKRYALLDSYRAQLLITHTPSLPRLEESTQTAKRLVKVLKKLHRWELLRNMHNPLSSISLEALQKWRYVLWAKDAQPGKYQALAADGRIAVPLKAGQKMAYSLRAINQTGRKLYVSVLVLDDCYEVAVLRDSVVWAQGKSIEFIDEGEAWVWPDTHESTVPNYIQCVFSTQPIENMSGLEQEGLPIGELLSADSHRQIRGAKPQPEPRNWAVRTVVFDLQRPD